MCTAPVDAALGAQSAGSRYAYRSSKRAHSFPESKASETGARGLIRHQRGPFHPVAVPGEAARLPGQNRSGFRRHDTLIVSRVAVSCSSDSRFVKCGVRLGLMAVGWGPVRWQRQWIRGCNVALVGSGRFVVDFDEEGHDAADDGFSIGKD